ncbi:MAG: tetratricopeptide repeat protein, partial [Thermoplasmata archaeon]
KTPNGLARERTRMLEYLLKQFVEIGAKQPVLFVVDDLHFADSATLAFFHYLSRNVRKERILVVATYVEEYANASTIFAKTLRNMSIERIYTTLRLGNFGERETESMVQQFGFENAKEAGKYIHERTSGNPFFVVEFLTALRAANVKEVDGIKKIVVPESVKGLIKLRVSKLSEKGMKALVASAILGRAFEYQAMKRLVDLDEEELLDALDELRDQHILVESGEFEEGYRFVSNTVQEVVYRELSGMRKKLLHQRAGNLLEEMHSADEKFWSAIATHYREGGNREKFIEYGIKAGRAAARRFANPEAIEFFKGVLEVMEEGFEGKVEILGELADVLELEGRFDEALEILDKRIGSTANIVETAKSYRRKCEIYISKGDYEGAWKEAERGERLLAETKEARHELARLWSAKGYVYERKGEYRKAIEWQEKALVVFEKVKAEKEMANAIHRIGACYIYLGEYEKAMEFFSKALGIREKINDLRGLTGSYNNIGIIYHDKGDYEKALEFHTKSLALREKIGDVWGIAISYSNIGIIYHDKGDYEKALEFYTKSLELGEKIGDVWGVAHSYTTIGAIYHDKGEYEKALEFYTKGLELREKIRDVWGIALSCYTIGILHQDKGDYEKALEFLTKSIELAKEIGDKSRLCEGLLRIAVCFLALKDTERSRKALGEARGIVTELGSKALEGSFLTVSGKLLVAEGNLGEGEEALAKAVEIYEKIGILDMDYHKTLFELGKIRKNKELLEKALAFFERIGNKVWADKVREEIGKVWGEDALRGGS